MAKEINMKRSIVIAATSILYLCTTSIASAQQTQPAQPSGQSSGQQSGQSGQSSGQSSQSSGASGTASAPVAGRVPLGVTVTEMEAIVLGWSVRKDLLGKTVINDKNEKIGKIDDIIISPKNSVSTAVIGVGGFLGMGKHDVAIPIEQLKLTGGNLILPGATKDALKALPPFEYAPRK
jgi:sporulation protein YlmC with PRC-barrel domain